MALRALAKVWRRGSVSFDLPAYARPSLAASEIDEPATAQFRQFGE